MKYVQQVGPKDNGTATILGTVFHAAMEVTLLGGSPIRAGLVSLAEEELEEVTRLDEKAEFDVQWCVNRALEMIPEGLALLDAEFPGWKIAGVEEEIYDPIALPPASHPEVNFKGFVDLALELPKEGKDSIFWVLDWKTAARPWNREKLSDPKVTYQLSLYKNFWAAKHRIPNERVRCGYLVGLKEAKPGKTFKLHPVSVGPTTAHRTLTVLNNFVHSMKNGMALKNKSEKNCKWCEFRGTEWCP